jgi:hypothetical protein
MPDDFGVTVVTNSYAFLFCMRGCGCIEHPAFPAPSEFQMRFMIGKTRADHAARSRRCGSPSVVPVKAGTHNQQGLMVGRRLNSLSQKLAPQSMGPCFRRDDIERRMMRMDRGGVGEITRCRHCLQYTGIGSLHPSHLWGGWHIVSRASDVTGGVVSASKVFSHLYALPHPTLRATLPTSGRDK